MMRVCCFPVIAAADIANSAAKNAAAGDKGPPEARQLPNTCEGCGRGLNTKQRNCDFCGRPTRL